MFDAASDLAASGLADHDSEMTAQPLFLVDLCRSEPTAATLRTAAALQEHRQESGREER